MEGRQIVGGVPRGSSDNTSVGGFRGRRDLVFGFGVGWSPVVLGAQRDAREGPERDPTEDGPTEVV